MIDNKLESKGLLAGAFLEVSGFDDNAAGDISKEIALVPVSSIDRIVPHPTDPEKTFVKRIKGCTDAYIDKPFDQFRKGL